MCFINDKNLPSIFTHVCSCEKPTNDVENTTGGVRIDEWVGEINDRELTRSESRGFIESFSISGRSGVQKRVQKCQTLVEACDLEWVQVIFEYIYLILEGIKCKIFSQFPQLFL